MMEIPAVRQTDIDADTYRLPDQTHRLMTISGAQSSHTAKRPKR